MKNNLQNGWLVSRVLVAIQIAFDVDFTVFSYRYEIVQIIFIINFLKNIIVLFLEIRWNTKSVS